MKKMQFGPAILVAAAFIGPGTVFTAEISFTTTSGFRQEFQFSDCIFGFL